MQIRTSYVKAFESYHLTDRQPDTTEIIYHAALRMFNYRMCGNPVTTI